MEIARFLKMSADEMNDYIKKQIPNIEYFRTQLLDEGKSISDILDISDFKFRNLARIRLKKVIKKDDMRGHGLGLAFISPALDLSFFDIQGKHLGDLWRYADGTNTFTALVSVNGMGERKIVKNILEMLKLEGYDDTL